MGMTKRTKRMVPSEFADLYRLGRSVISECRSRNDYRELLYVFETLSIEVMDRSGVTLEEAELDDDVSDDDA